MTLDDCVAGKVPKLIAEGYEQSQAVAIAYEICSGKAWANLSEAEQEQLTMRVPPRSVRSTAVKQLDGRRIGGYGSVFGSPSERDLAGEYFSTRTDYMLDFYPSGQPVFWEHTLGVLPDGFGTTLPRNFLIGRVAKAQPDAVGLWIEAVLLDFEEWRTSPQVQTLLEQGALSVPTREEYNQWIGAILSLIDQGILHWSSGSAPHLVSYASDLEILSWPVVEMSVTPTPAEPRQTDIIRLKHFVNRQETSPEATADKAARRHAPGVVRPLSYLTSKEGRPMTLRLTEKAVKQIVWAVADANQGKLKAAFDAYKQDEGEETPGVTENGENAIAELVRPLAEELAVIAGAEVEETQQYLIEYVAAHATGEPEPEPEPEGEAPPEIPATMSAADVQKHIDKAVEKRMQGLLKPRPDGGHLTPRQKNVRMNLMGTKEIKSLTKLVRAIRDNDLGALRDHNDLVKEAHKAMGINPDTAGGYLVAPTQGAQIIGELEAKTVVLPLCQQIPMPDSDTMTVPTDDGGTTAYWIGENAQITASDNTFGQRRMVARKLAALVKVSNELLESSSPDVEAYLRAKIARKLALKIDESILQGSGVGEEPQGLANYPATVTKTALNAAPTVTNILDMISRVEVEDVETDPMWHFVFNPRDKATLAKVQDATSGDFLWTELGLPGHTLVGGYPPTLRGYPFVTTSQITIDTVNNNETKIYFGQFFDLLVGMHKSIELMASNVAGTSFEYNQTWIRAIMRLDWVLQYDESIEILTDVRTS